MPTIPTTMHAAAEFGGPEVLKLHTLPFPAPAAGEVLIRIDTAGCNPASCVRRSVLKSALTILVVVLPRRHGLRACRISDSGCRSCPDRLHLDAKWFYGMRGRRVMDERLAPEFIRQMTRRYGIAALIQIAAVLVVIAALRVGVAIALLCVAFFLLPQPKPRYKPGEEPNEAEKLNA